MSDRVGGFEKRIILLEQVLSLGAKLASLSGDLAAEETSGEFDRLLLEQQSYLEQIDEMDRLDPIESGYTKEQTLRTAELLTGINANTQQMIGNLTRESQSLKQQMEDHLLRRKSLLVYSNNVLAKKSMIVDQSQ